MEARTFPCQAHESLDRFSLHIAGRLVCGMGLVDHKEPDAADLERAAVVAEELLDLEMAATYLRNREPQVLACARNRAAGFCLNQCGSEPN